jgi:hypothetical protein
MRDKVSYTHKTVENYDLCLWTGDGNTKILLKDGNIKTIRKYSL